jgi:cytochrome c oxidase cbb3-type subunit 1
MGLVLTAGGLQQGYMWMSAVEWVDSMVAMKPYWVVRTVAGVTMDIGMTLLVYNLARTIIAAPKQATQPAPLGMPPVSPAGARP